MLFVAGLACCLAVIGLQPAMSAQQTPSQDVAHGHAGLWRASTFHTPDAANWKLSPAQVNTIHAKLKLISDVFRDVPALKPPVGVEILVNHGAGGNGITSDGGVLRMPPSGIDLRMFVYGQTCESCAVRPAEESSGDIGIEINSIDVLYENWRQPYATDDKGPMFVAPNRVGELAGFPIYEAPGRGRKVVLTNGNTRPLWVPVSQERYIRHLLAVAEKSIADYRSRGKTNAYAERDARELEAELAGLSAAELSAPAALGGRSTRKSGLTAAGPTTRLLVSTNPDFFDRTLARTAFQIAVVYTRPPDLRSIRTSFVGQKLQAVMDATDWQRIASLLQ